MKADTIARRRSLRARLHRADSVLGGIILLLLFLHASATSSSACGPASDCSVGERVYRIWMPERHEASRPVGALVFAHGYMADYRRTTQNPALLDLARKLGIALIGAKSKFEGWALPGSPAGTRGVDELAYFDSVLDDAAARFPIDRKRIVMSGFSAGGMMTWTLACHRSGDFAGFIPLSGTFWRPIPEACRNPVASIVHIHGDNDVTVPLGGRQIRQARQGDVPSAIAMYQRFGGFTKEAVSVAGPLRCTERRNASGNLLSFCIFEGGHTYDVRHIESAWEMLARAGQV